MVWNIALLLKIYNHPTKNYEVPRRVRENKKKNASSITQKSIEYQGNAIQITKHKTNVLVLTWLLSATTSLPI